MVSPRGERDELTVARVFVGIPTYNRPDYLRETVRSVLDQTLGDFRAVISDNASTPDNAEGVARFVRELDDSRVSYYLQPANGMEYGQGRYLFGECREEFFMILHDDDILDPEYLETAVRSLEDHPELAAFVANPRIIDSAGNHSEAMTREYLAEHGRLRYGEGVIDILESVMRCGLPPISGTFFRTSALRASGFVDDECYGSYPFEFNVMLRLGEREGRAWFTKRDLLAFRFHEASGRQTTPLRFNEQAVTTMLKLLGPRSFSGVHERLRRKTEAFTRRHHALILLGKGETAAARSSIVRAVRLNPLSYRNWTYAVGVLFVPFLLRPRFRGRIG